MREVRSRREVGRNWLWSVFVLLCLSTFAFLLLPCSTLAQSSDQNFPTHVTSNEINGVIKPRNIGDARLTTYYYLFEGTQGDIFINVATTNFSGDIDVYVADSLKPLTKMVMYADAGRSETGRLIYLRQPTRMLLRIEGRTPNDDVATFRIKFAGSFVALASEPYEPPPTVKRSGETAEPKEPTVAGEAKTEEQKPKAEEQSTKTEDPKPKTEDQPSETIFENKSAKVTVKPPKAPPVRKAARATKVAKPKDEKPNSEDQKPKVDPPPDPLANVRLVVVFKDGVTVEHSMIEVARFSFDRGILTIVEKSGKNTRYQMIDITKVTIE